MNCECAINEIPRKPYQGHAPKSEEQHSLKELLAGVERKTFKLL